MQRLPRQVPLRPGLRGLYSKGEVGAYYLLSMLAGGEPRGLLAPPSPRMNSSALPTDSSTMSSFMRPTAKASQAVLEIQVKRTIDFSSQRPGISRTRGPVAKAAAKSQNSTYSVYEPRLRPERTSTKIERSYQEVLSWARELGRQRDIVCRLNKKRLANSDYAEIR